MLQQALGVSTYSLVLCDKGRHWYCLRGKVSQSMNLCYFLNSLFTHHPHTETGMVLRGSGEPTGSQVVFAI